MRSCLVIKELERNGLTIRHHSCEDKDTIEPQISRLCKAAMAAVWQCVVCRMHDSDYWEFIESWNSYVPLRRERKYTGC